MATHQHVGLIKRRLDEGIQTRQTNLLTLGWGPALSAAPLHRLNLASINSP